MFKTFPRKFGVCGVIFNWTYPVMDWFRQTFSVQDLKAEKNAPARQHNQTQPHPNQINQQRIELRFSIRYITGLIQIDPVWLKKLCWDEISELKINPPKLVPQLQWLFNFKLTIQDITPVIKNFIINFCTYITYSFFVTLFELELVIYCCLVENLVMTRLDWKSQPINVIKLVSG